MHIILDGYNVIRQSRELISFERAGMESGRRELIRRVALYRKSKGHDVTIVFDGWQGGNTREESTRINGLRVIYSKIGETADEVIKRLAREERGQELVVVSSDREIAKAAERAGAVVITSSEFEIYIHGGPIGESFFDNNELEEEEEYGQGKERKKGPSKRISKKKRKIMRSVQKL